MLWTQLAKHDVRLVSITQPLGNDEDPAQAMMRKVIALFDEYQSKEKAKHVLRNMKLNAEQNFWNGSRVPLGYKLAEVEKRGTKIKKTLAIDPVQAETIKMLFNLYLHGDGTSGAMGIKEMAKWLNSLCTHAWATLPQVIRDSSSAAGVISVAEVKSELGKLLRYHVVSMGANGWQSAFHRGLIDDAPAQHYLVAQASQAAVANS